MKLVIVESPGKIDTIQSFLTKDFVVKATKGHCFELLHSIKAINIEKDFELDYIAISRNEAIVRQITALSKQADEVYLATDKDREGESIAYLIAKYAIKDDSKIKRIVFNEITKTAILKAIANPISIDEDLVKAQQSRSALDLYVGFNISPILWFKILKGTSAGRVQSIGLRLVVDRQREIDNFKPEEFWKIKGTFSNKEITLDTLYHSENPIPNKTIANKIKCDVEALSDWRVVSVDKLERQRQPNAVFNTSSLQQFCATHFGLSGRQTMKIAQSLYELGHITYHRTDSVAISEEAIVDVRKHISDVYGEKYCPDQKREFKSKNKVAQEAHEGIRPTHLNLKPKSLKMISRNLSVYEAIYNRFVACQMADALVNTTKITIKSDSTNHMFTTSGQTIKFDGFLKVWKYGTTKDEVLPEIKENEKLKLKSVETEKHLTKPPAGYTTASLIKILEEEGVGRPSTYASIVDTLQTRNYMIVNEKKTFIPTDLGCRVSDFLVTHFPELMDIKFTARMEDELDEIANGKKDWRKVIREFFIEVKRRVVVAQKVKSQKIEIPTDILCPVCKAHNLVIREGRISKFYGCDGLKDKNNTCKAFFKIGPNKEPISMEEVQKQRKYLEGKVCDRCGSKIIIRVSNRTGKEFRGCSAFPKCKRLFTEDGTPIEYGKKRKEKDEQL